MLIEKLPVIKMKYTHAEPVKTCLILLSQITNESGAAFNIPVQIQNNRGTACLVLQIYWGTKCKTIKVFCWKEKLIGQSQSPFQTRLLRRNFILLLENLEPSQIIWYIIKITTMRNILKSFSSCLWCSLLLFPFSDPSTLSPKKKTETVWKQKIFVST